MASKNPKSQTNQPKTKPVKNEQANQATGEGAQNEQAANAANAMQEATGSNQAAGVSGVQGNQADGQQLTDTQGQAGAAVQDSASDANADQSNSQNGEKSQDASAGSDQAGGAGTTDAATVVAEPTNAAPVAAVTTQPSSTVVEPEQAPVTSTAAASADSSQDTANEPAAQVDTRTPAEKIDQVLVERIGKVNSSSAKVLLEMLRDYAAEIRRTMDEQKIAQLQKRLSRFMIQAINSLEYPDFRQVWAGFLAAIVAGQDGVFGQLAFFRSHEAVDLTEEERQTFARLQNLAFFTADPRSRRAYINQIDLDKTLAVGITENGRNNVQQFYAASTGS